MFDAQGGEIVLEVLPHEGFDFQASTEEALPSRETAAIVREPIPAPASSSLTGPAGSSNIAAMNCAIGDGVMNCPSAALRAGSSFPLTTMRIASESGSRAACSEMGMGISRRSKARIIARGRRYSTRGASPSFTWIFLVAPSR